MPSICTTPSSARSVAWVSKAALNQRDGIFVLRSDQLQPADRILLETVAGVILDEKGGTLAEHALRLTVQPTHLPGFTPSLSPARDPEPTPSLQLPGDLLMDNGLGGFSRDGKEYVIHLTTGSAHAAPVGQRHCQPAVWISGLRGWFRLYLGREQRREPPDPLAQRPGDRYAGRGHLPARRGNRAGLEPHTHARRSRNDACHSSRGGLFDL